MARLSGDLEAVRIGPQMYRVEIDGRASIVYAIAAGQDVWAWWKGHAYRLSGDADEPSSGRATAASGRQALTAPMPATVLKINVEVGRRVHKGDPLILLEAMKMELPIRAAADGVVTALHCRERELVPPERILIEIAPEPPASPPGSAP